MFVFSLPYQVSNKRDKNTLPETKTQSAVQSERDEYKKEIIREIEVELKRLNTYLNKFQEGDNRKRNETYQVNNDFFY